MSPLTSGNSNVHSIVIFVDRVDVGLATLISRGTVSSRRIKVISTSKNDSTTITIIIIIIIIIMIITIITIIIKHQHHIITIILSTTTTTAFATIDDNTH